MKAALPPIPREMRAVVYRGVNDLRVEMISVPRINSGELLVKVAVCGVCPTDIKKIQYGTVTPPRVFGHETAGTIVRVGAKVRGFKVNDRVALHHHVPCMECHFCRHHTFAQCPQYKRTGITAGFEPAGGGFAEYVRVMSFVLPGVVKIPAKNSFEEAAMLEPVNTVLKGVRKLALLKGDTVLVAGQGPIGLMFTRLLALEGIRVIATDLFESRLNLARGFGAWKTFRGDGKRLEAKIHSAAGGQGVDAAIIAVPVNGVVSQARRCLRGGGQVLLFAHTKRGDMLETDAASVCVDEISLLGSYSSDLTLQAEAAKAVFSRKLDVRKLITHRFELVKVAAAVEMAASPSPDSLKIVVYS